MKHLCLFVLLLIMLLNTGNASNSLTLTDKSVEYDASSFLSYYSDTSKILSIYSIIEKDDSIFNKNMKSPLNLGVVSNPVWFKFDVNNQLSHVDWVMEVKYPTLNRVTFYIVDRENKVDTVIYSGKDHFDEYGKTYSYTIFFHLPIEPKQDYRVYFQVETESFMILPITIRSTQRFFDYYRQELTLFNILYGLLIGFVVFNMMLFVLTRERSYLILTLYLLTLSLNAYFMHGYGFNLFSRIDAFYASRMRQLLFGLGSFLFLLFTINYLDLKKYKTLHRIILFLSVLSVLYSLLLLFRNVPQSVYTRISTPLFIMGAFFSLYAGIRTFIKGERLAFYYVLSFVFITAASVIYSLTLYGILPFSNFTFNINLLGTLTFSLLLTIGLIEKITTIKQERLKSQLLESMVGKLNNEINERKKVEKELRDSEIRFRLLFEMSPQPISLTSVESGRIIDINRQMETFLGYSREEALNKTSLELSVINPQTRRQMIDKLMADGYLSGFELQLRNKEGKISDALAYMQVIDIMGNESLVTVFIDVTAQKHKEQQLIESEKELRALNASKDKFFSIIGHDLMNPFNAMMGFVQLLIDSTKENEKDKCLSYLMLIDQSSKRIFNLLQNLLLWSKTQSHKVVFSPAYINVVELLMNSIDILKSEAYCKKIEIELDIMVNEKVYADENMISVVIRNLVSNAIKHSAAGSKVLIKYHKNENTLLFSVADQGSGIEPERLTTLFNNLYNIESSGREEVKLGFGLGLILCSEFIKMHNGHIWAESELGKGSTFYFTIPVVDL